MPRPLAARAAAAAAAILLLLPAAGTARTFRVTEHKDPVPGACTAADCTLREAVIAANERAGKDTILLPSRAPYILQRASSGEDAARNGDLDITSGPLTVVHRGKGTAIIDARRTDRIFDIGAARTRLQKLTIRGGRAHPVDAGGDGGGISAGDIGDAPVTVVRCVITNNQTPTRDGNGGGIDTDIDGVFTIVDSVVSQNRANGDGGGITGSLDGPVVIIRTTILGNTAGEGGGVMAVSTPTTVLSSTIAFNRAVGGLDGEVGDGGGIYVDDEGTLALLNSTLTRNRADSNGGGVFGETGGQASLVAATVARNHAGDDPSSGGQGGGIQTDGAVFSVVNSIVALNTAGASAPSDCGGTGFTGASTNLVVSGNCSAGAEIVTADPGIGGLQRNGGPTKTIPLLDGSPAIGAAEEATAPARDQRGNVRSDPDLGAFER